jgi:hypothetical protein
MEPTENTDRPNTPTSKPLASETPFFARFLEGQETESKLNAAHPGTIRATLKYPSDNA